MQTISYFFIYKGDEELKPSDQQNWSTAVDHVFPLVLDRMNVLQSAAVGDVQQICELSVIRTQD